MKKKMDIIEEIEQELNQDIYKEIALSALSEEELLSIAQDAFAAESA